MRKSFIGVALASTIMFSGGMTNVYADSPVVDISPTEIYNNTPLPIDKELEKQYKFDFIYVIDKEKYKDIISKNTALFIIKDRLLIVDSKELTDEELDSIKSSKDFYVIGEPENQLKELEEEENFRAELLSENKMEVFIELAHEDGLDKDIIIANGNSIADSLTGIQLSKLKDANLILIEDEIPEVVKEFLKEYGSEKNISFVEGEQIIDDEVKKEVLKLAGNTRYEINTSDFIKSGFVSKLGYDSSADVETTESTETSNVEQEDVIRPETDSLISGLNTKMKDSIVNVANKRSEGEKEIINGTEKVISLNIDNNADEFSDVITTESVEIVENDKVKVEEIIKKANNDEEVSAHKLTLVNNTPIDKDKLKELKDVSDNYYIVPMDTDENIIELVMYGKYGNGAERREALLLDGYNYEEVQREIKVIVDKRVEEERQAMEALQTQLAEEQQLQTLATGANLNGSVNGAQQSTQTQQTQQTQQSTQIQQTAPSQQSSGNVESFLNSLTSMQGWTYSQPKRMQVGYADCSSIIIRAMIDAGITSNKANLTTRSIAGDSRFYEIPMSQMKRGDILWTSGHTEVYMGGNSTFGAFKPGKPAGYGSETSRFSKAYRINGF